MTEPEAHNAIHGFLRWRNWTLREHVTDRVVLGTVLHPCRATPSHSTSRSTTRS
ncbi:MAG: hypothetical protein LC808_36210 [Actinobacteria bacterium]|nr:hypothetical protein [Actinomycetota bacterium]MCA1708435.1 hypothetical protein [Actinomycetota bacterium]